MFSDLSDHTLGRSAARPLARPLKATVDVTISYGDWNRDEANRLLSELASAALFGIDPITMDKEEAGGGTCVTIQIVNEEAKAQIETTLANREKITASAVTRYDEDHGTETEYHANDPATDE